MTWKSLADPDTGLGKRPHVLAGPMLRKVTPQSVTVWVALRLPGKVTLKVLDAGFEMTGSGQTVAIGTNLHIVAVTTAQPAAGVLVEGKIYRYDLQFDYGNLSETLKSATGDAKLAYDGFDKPSFCLPPADITKLRIMHGSCRIPHGNGDDTLPMLDTLIETSAKDPFRRPHQLLLTGDQIYADDVGYAMSMMLMDASEALLGWTEEIVCNVPARDSRRPVTDMYPRLRGHITQIDAGFTSVDFHGQLVGLGEYLAMYLFVWSEVLWPASFDLPTADEIKSYFSPRMKATDKPVLDEQTSADISNFDMYRLLGGAFDADDVDDETKRTARFGGTIKSNVRRALANIPSYMIFDDHEVTDDWNMTRQFCEKVYTSQLGLRIVQNGLTAYALCQHWGNVPEDFFTTSASGGKLLGLLDKMSSATAYDSASAGIRSLLGITTLKGTPPGLTHDAKSLTYNYTVEGEGHQVIVTDTRSWRSYPRGALDGGDLMPPSQIEAQIANARPPTRKGNRDRMLLIVLTTNAPACQSIRTASSHPAVTKKLAGDPFPDLYESWEMSRNTTDLLFKAISSRLPLVQGTREGSALLLSGDVHTSFTSRLLYRATSRYQDQTAQPVNAVFVQMVCSSLRKQTDKTEGQHVDGYKYAPTGAGWMVPARKPETYLGWNLPSGQNKLLVGRKKRNPGSGRSFKRIEIEWSRTYSIWPMTHGFKEEVKHDWSYRLDYLDAGYEMTLPAVPSTPVPVTDRQRTIDLYQRTMTKYRDWIKSNSRPRQIVGLNNIGEISFDASNAIHTLRWHDYATRTDRMTIYTCILDPKEQKYLPLEGLLP